MSMTTEKVIELRREAPIIEDYELDLIHELGRRMGCLWGYDRYIANADGRPELQEFWRGAKSQEQANIDRLKKLIQQHVPSNGS